MRHGEREDNTNCGGFDYRAEGVRVIKTKKSSVALCNEARFEALNGSIGKIVRKTHLEPIILILEGRGTRSQV